MDGWRRIGLDDAFPKLGKLLPIGPARGRFGCWARWARFFIPKKLYTSKCNTFIFILPFPMVRGSGNGWMGLMELR